LKTFESLRDAQEWRRIVEGKVTGDEFVDLKGRSDDHFGPGL
jgi:hypothetical protein